MADKVVIDVNDLDFEPKSKAMELAEKLGRFAMKMQEDDAKIQRMLQSYIPSSYPTLVDTEAIRNTVSEYVPDSIIPDDYFEKTQEYQQKSLEALQSINENTANLYTLVELINKNNDNQEEILSVISEILAIATAKSKEEVESLFKKAMKKLTESTESVDSIIKITGWATAIYNMVSSML